MTEADDADALRAALAKVEDEIASAYWRFSRTSSPKVGPPPASLYTKRAEIKRRLRAAMGKKSD